MPDKKISELNIVNLPLTGTEEIPIVQNGETKKVLSSEFLSEFDNKSTTIFLTGNYDIDWSAFSVWDITLTGNTTLTQINAPDLGKEKTIVLYIKGNFALNLPTQWEIKNGGSYDGVNGSQIVVQSWDNVPFNPNFYTVINNENGGSPSSDKRIFNFSNSGFRVYNNSTSAGVKNFFTTGANAAFFNMNFDTSQTDANLLNIIMGVNQMLVAPYDCKVKNVAFDGEVVQEFAVVSAEGDQNDMLIYNTTNSYDRDISTSQTINKGEFIGLFLKLKEDQTQQYRSSYLMVDFEEI